MRYVAIQVLTWGTIAGAVGSACLLAAFDRSTESYVVFALDPSLIVPSVPAQAARKRADRNRQASPAADAATSAPRTGDR